MSGRTSIGGVELDHEWCRLRFRRDQVRITPGDARLFGILAAASPHLVSHGVVLAAMYLAESPPARPHGVLRQRVFRLRRALEEIHAPLEIAAAPGRGYGMLVTPSAERGAAAFAPEAGRVAGDVSSLYLAGAPRRAPANFSEATR